MSSIDMPVGTPSAPPKRPATPPKFDPSVATKFFDHIFDSELGVHEIRVFHARYGFNGIVSPNEISHSATLGGWYDNVKDFLIDLGRIEGVSAYVTINPITQDIMGRSYNRLKLLRSGLGSKDIDVVKYRHALIDIDSERHVGVSATDEELAMTIVTRDQILSDHPEVERASIWGCSGNGAWILVRLPDYPPRKGHDLVAHFLDRIDTLYSVDKKVKIDVSTKNPARIMGIPGTVKCKGTSMPDRPHRLVTIDSPEGREFQSLDLKAWLKINHHEIDAEAHDREPGEETTASNGKAEVGQPNMNGHASGASDSKSSGGSAVYERARRYLASIESAVAGQKGSDKAFHVACVLVKGFNLTPNESWPLWQEWNLGCQPPWSNSESWHKLNDADKKFDDKPRGYLIDETLPAPIRVLAGDPAAQENAGGKRDNEILITTDEIDINNKVCDLLGDFKGLYQRNYGLVEVVRESVDIYKKRIGLVPEGTPMIAMVPPIRLREIVSKVVRFRKKLEGRYYPAHPPEWCVSAVHSRRNWNGVPVLSSVVEHPALRPDGTVIDQPGYDEATGVYWIDNCPLLPIDRQPTREDATDAAKRLLDLVGEFPFQRECDKAAWLACLLTVLNRHLIDDAVPLFLFEASVSGSGKTLLCDIISRIATGRDMVRSSYYHDSVEMDKQIVATCLGGIRVTMLDNIEGQFGNSALDNALTGRYYRGRILGKSEMTGALLLDTVFVATGNNIQFCGDIFRRIVPCRLESQYERPDKDKTDYQIRDIKNHVMGKRASLVKDALTISKAYIDAGSPEMFPLNVYPGWTRCVRSALKWATGEDCMGGQEEVKGADQERQGRAEVVEGIAELLDYFDRETITANEILNILHAEQYRNFFLLLREGISGLWSRRDLPSLGSFSKRLMSLRSTRFGDIRLVKHSQQKHTTLWAIQDWDASTLGWTSHSKSAPPF